MAYVNFKELKEERPARNFDKVDITEDFDIGAQDGDSLYGTFSFFHGIKSFFKKVMSATSALVSGKILMSDKNGNVAGIAPSDLKTGMDLMNSEDVNNALADKQINSNPGKFVETFFNSHNFNDFLETGFYRVNEINNYSNAPAGASSYGQLIVSHNQDTIYQQYSSWGGESGNIYVRCFNVGGSGYEWTQLAKKSDLTNYNRQERFNAVTVNETNIVIDVRNFGENDQMIQFYWLSMGNGGHAQLGSFLFTRTAGTFNRININALDQDHSYSYDANNDVITINTGDTAYYTLVSYVIR